MTTRKVHFQDEKDIVETFQPTSETFTPKIKEKDLKYRTPSSRVELGTSYAPSSSVSKPNYDDSLRRVSVVVYQHVCRCEKRYRQSQHIEEEKSDTKETAYNSSSSLKYSMSESSAFHDSTNPNIITLGNALLSGKETLVLFDESNFLSTQYQYRFIRNSQIRPFILYQMEKVKLKHHLPTVDEIYRFCRHLFTKAQLSAECTIVCLVYVERLMERANIPLLCSNWKPIILCGLLLSSKVWQDFSSWNIEFSSIYPQFSLININRLERLFLHHIQWDLYISGSVYAKYYFALRSLTEKKDFRRRYNYTLNVDPPNSKRLEERSAAMKSELYSTSL